jgi:GT2 family glycosyltransferase
MPGVPEISVIITTYNARDSIGRCLMSLARQETGRVFEIILIDSSSDGTDRLVQAQFPSVQLNHFDRRLYCGDARNHGLTLARAPVIAFLDADCFVHPDWIDSLWAAHQLPEWVVGGGIDNGSPDSILAWAYYFCEFNLWLPCSKVHYKDEIAGCCLSMKRVAYDTYGPFVEGTYSSDTAFHWKLKQGGHQVLIHPAIRVYHTIACSLRGFFRHIFEHRRAFARVCSQEHHYSRRYSLLRAVLSLGLPIPLSVCVAWRVIHSRLYWKPFLLASPLIGAGFGARAIGEFVGFLCDHDQAFQTSTWQSQNPMGKKINRRGRRGHGGSR